VSKVQDRIEQLNKENEKLNLEIHTAQNRKVQIGFILAELNQLVDNPPKVKIAAPESKVKIDVLPPRGKIEILDTSNMSLRKAIIAIMLREPTRRWAVEDIKFDLDKTGRAIKNKQQLYNALSALVSEKKLNRITDGLFTKGKK